MKPRLSNIAAFALICAGLTLLIGCASSGGNQPMADYEAMLKEKDQEIKTLESESNEKDQLIESYQKELKLSQKAAAEAQREGSTQASATESLFPPNAKAGECWARVFVQPEYRTITERVLKRGASERLEIVQAKYEWVEERVMVKEASERMEIIPAEYSWVEEKVLVKPASTKLVEVPASYEMQEEKILVKEAHTVWKKGRGPIEKIDNTTGEIMCLVEIPAVYKTVSKRVMVSPPATKEMTIPAEYKTVKKRIMVKPPTERKIVIPAEYKTVKVRKMVSPPREARTPIAAEYQTVTRTEKVSDGHMAWRRVLCETNVSQDIIREVQLNLSNEGYDPGPIDGVIGWRTGNALKSYQRANNLGVGGLTYETLKHMKINL
jgi:hypothetical protein